MLEPTTTALSSPQSLPLLLASVVTSVSHPLVLQPATLTDTQQCPSLAIVMPSVATSVSHTLVLQPAMLTDVQPHLSPAIVTAAAMLTAQAQEHPLASSPILVVQQQSKPLKSVMAPEPQPGTMQPAVSDPPEKGMLYISISSLVYDLPHHYLVTLKDEPAV